MTDWQNGRKTETLWNYRSALRNSLIISELREFAKIVPKFSKVYSNEGLYFVRRWKSALYKGGRGWGHLRRRTPGGFLKFFFCVFGPHDRSCVAWNNCGDFYPIEPSKNPKIFPNYTCSWVSATYDFRGCDFFGLNLGQV